MWIYKNKIITDEDIKDCVGFVYIIKNLDKGMYYIGKKSFTKMKRIQKNNKKRRKTVESDWKTYTGSNYFLNEDISNGDKITKEILYLCKSKSEMSYFEAKEQFLLDVLKDKNSYNQWIMVKIRKAHLI
jgi:hypothetical protein